MAASLATGDVASHKCIFCKIVAGALPCTKVYETEHIVAILDINPVARGHCLVLPKVHAEYLHELPLDAAVAMSAALPRVARALQLETRAAGYNIMNNNGPAAGQEVPHVHFHVIPRFPGDALRGIYKGLVPGKLATTYSDANAFAAGVYARLV